MKDLKDLAQDLNLLLARNLDAREGYVEASHNLNNGSELDRWMHEYSDQRLHFSVALKKEISQLGGDPDFDTSALGDLHRAWIDLKGTFSDNEQLAMLQECHRGETTAFENYQEILEDYPAMPNSTRNMLIEQQSKIKGAIAQIETMVNLLEEVEA